MCITPCSLCAQQHSHAACVSLTPTATLSPEVLRCVGERLTLYIHHPTTVPIGRADRGRRFNWRSWERLSARAEGREVVKVGAWWPGLWFSLCVHKHVTCHRSAPSLHSIALNASSHLLAAHTGLNQLDVTGRLRRQDYRKSMSRGHFRFSSG